jgi:hypothetical protein
MSLFTASEPLSGTLNPKRKNARCPKSTPTQLSPVRDFEEVKVYPRVVPLIISQGAGSSTGVDFWPTLFGKLAEQIRNIGAVHKRLLHVILSH